MRIVVWNMNKRPAAWEYLRGLEFDVALLQETRDPREWVRDWSVCWTPYRGDPGSRRTLWGTAIVATRMELSPWQPTDERPWLGALGGSVTVARSSGSPSWFASVHACASQIEAELLDRYEAADVPLATPNGSVWEQDVIPFELCQLFGDETFLWGGDLNSAESMDEGGFLGGNRKLREIWREAGSLDLRLRFFPEEQRTFFATGRRAYQLDHVFADAETERRVTDWQVDLAPVEVDPRISDHAPIIVELD